MKARVSIAIFMLLSFLNIGAISSDFSSNRNTLGVLESNMRNKCEFEENGVKLQYRTKEDLQTELCRVKNYLTHYIEGDYEEIEKNEFNICNNDCNINVKMWCEDEYNYVEITFINRNYKDSTTHLIDMLKKLENSKTEKIEYNTYYEGKELEDSYSIGKLINENNIKDTKLLRISNGYTGTGYFNGDKINFAQIRYDTGSHIIIGTPIIFTTY